MPTSKGSSIGAAVKEIENFFKEIKKIIDDINRNYSQEEIEEYAREQLASFQKDHKKEDIDILIGLIKSSFEGVHLSVIGGQLGKDFDLMLSDVSDYEWEQYSYYGVFNSTLQLLGSSLTYLTNQANNVEDDKEVKPYISGIRDYSKFFLDSSQKIRELYDKIVAGYIDFSKYELQGGSTYENVILDNIGKYTVEINKLSLQLKSMRSSLWRLRVPLVETKVENRTHGLSRW